MDILQSLKICSCVYNIFSRFHILRNREINYPMLSLPIKTDHFVHSTRKVDLAQKILALQFLCNISISLHKNCLENICILYEVTIFVKTFSIVQHGFKYFKLFVTFDFWKISCNWHYPVTLFYLFKPLFQQITLHGPFWCPDGS